MLFVSACVVCGHDGGPVCAACASRLTPVAGTQRLVPVQHCSAEPAPGLEQCRAPLVLDDVSRPIIAAMKYRRQHRLARWFAAQAAPLVPLAADVLTWIPATPDRRRSRGFDQGQELARHLGRHTGVPVRRLLDRHKSDRRQTGRTRTDRQVGPQLRPHASPPPFVVVIDDVVTTGSSMRAAATVLRVSGAARVVGLAMAATPPKHDRVSLRT